MPCIQSADARRALPCWDDPEFKATFDVVLTVPRDITALSNMVIKAENCTELILKFSAFAVLNDTAPL